MGRLIASIDLEDWIVCLLSLALITTGLLALGSIGSPLQVYPAGFHNMRPYLIGLFAIYSGLLLISLARHRPDSPIAFLVGTGPGREVLAKVLRQLPLILAIALFMPTFSAVKSSIPLFSGFSWDDRLIALDRDLHGTDPWRLLQPIFGQPWITSLMARFYHLWFLLIYVGPLFFAVFVHDRTLRFRFFASYLLTWGIVGMVMAIGFASVGPCFVGPILGNDHFAEQMHYLYLADRQYPVAVLEIQELLLEWHRQGQNGLGRGITAMPSMHVALAFLYVLAVRPISKPLAWAMFAFFLIIMIGSVHLAYHYAVDGYVSIAVTGAIWMATKPISRLILGADQMLTKSERANAGDPAVRPSPLPPA